MKERRDCSKFDSASGEIYELIIGLMLIRKTDRERIEAKIAASVS